MSLFQSLFKRKAPKVILESRVFRADGINVFVWDWDKRRISGWNHSIRIGDRVLVAMVTGKTAELEVIELERYDGDQYFATVKDIGYYQEVPDEN